MGCYNYSNGLFEIQVKLPKNWVLITHLFLQCRGGIEHCNLKISQLQRESVMIDGKSMGSYVYCEHGLKNNQGGFASLSLQNKIVRQYESTLLRCYVKNS